MTEQAGDLLAKVRKDADELAATLLEATEAGVPPALIVPVLIGVFRAAFGPIDPAQLAQLSGLARGG